MRPNSLPLIFVALTACAAALSAHGEGSASSASSTASSGSSASVGSSSTSIEKSSNASSGNNNVAAGDYRIVEIADAAARPGMLRLHLRALGDEAPDVFLVVPQETVLAGELATGQVVSARARAYGMEFARAESGQAFFLVLDDAWHRELHTRPVAM